VVESKPDLNSLISKPNDLDANKNEVTPPADTTFKSSISDGPIDEKASAQLASDKEVSSVSSSSGLFIFLGVLLAILIMLFVIKTKKQQEQKELIDYINTDEDKPEVSSIKEESSVDEVNLSGIEINLSDKDQKPTHLD
jgi:preprotein translocase subunit YajC